MNVDENVDGTPMHVVELWFSDGSLVVQAEKSLFRVSGAVLAARSSVFNDMLGIAQPADTETIDGCPMVRLPDSAEDVTCFFRAIFDSSFFEPYPCKVSFGNALSIARLSHKYSVDYLLRRALVHLSYEFPTTLSAFDKWPDMCSTDFREVKHGLSPYVAVVQLARQVNAPWMLPLAFYKLASADGKIIQKVLRCKVFKKHAARLEDNDKLVFLTCSILLAGLESKAVSFLHSSDKCASSKKCNTARLSALTQVQNSVEEAVGPDPLDVGLNADVWDILEEGCSNLGQASRNLWTASSTSFLMEYILSLVPTMALREGKDGFRCELDTGKGGYC
ncbi:hypothetical protein MSAN_01243100 [Mycena sanguinolenta]|uniref:BTB domain-containing protein n=1 Tax=Mycena sanguinolenta TaxID=230812 RepID=A0A8H6YHE4_9AGAR|nr:hypothetical protein MSAN_01243100 [Mycena sanguinolenta]